MPYFSTKTYGPEAGLSATFRQHRADSHCRLIHGYALSFKFTFGCTELDKNGWVMDFGDCKLIKKWLESTFDHKMLVAEDDPRLDELTALGALGLADVLVIEGTGCEAFAEMAANYVQGVLIAQTNGRVFLVSVECREHNGNSAIYEPDFQ